MGKRCWHPIMRKILLLLLFVAQVCFGQTFQIHTLNVLDNTNSSSSTTGGATFAGGIGVVGNIFSAGSVNGASGNFGTGSFTSLSASTSATVPTAALGTNTGAAASTQFVQAAGLHYQQTGGLAFTVNTSVGASSLGSWGEVQAAGLTITLPALSSTQFGQSFTFIPSNYGFTVAAAGSDIIVSVGAINNTSYTVAPGESVTFTSNTSDWFVSLDGITSKVGSYCSSIMAYGGNNAGTAVNNTALTNALTVGGSNPCVFLPPGNYSLNAGFSYTLPNNTASLTIIGSGQQVTNVTVSGSGDGFDFYFPSNANSIHFRDMTIMTNQAGGGTGVQVSNTTGNVVATDQTASDFTNVTFRGSDGIGATDYWVNGISLVNVSNFNFTNLFVIGPSAHNAGVGVKLNSTVGAYYPIVFNFQGCQFNELSQGIYYGQNVQGVTVNQSNFTNDSNGIWVPSGITGTDQLSVSGSQFNTFSEGIGMNSAVIQTSIVNNLFLIEANSTGIYFNSYSQSLVVGNNFGCQSTTGTNAVTFVTRSALSALVTGNTFVQCATGINLTSTSTNVNVQSNSYNSNTNNVVNSCSSGCTVGGGSQ
jgi:hypothetical protein